MENASKALYMAGALLIALLVISLLVYTFKNLGKVQAQKDLSEYEEEITAFNIEYEAFNKKIMYGVDVISCINKAINHNKKYVNGEAKGSGNRKYGDEALIQIKVDLKGNSLKENIEIYHFDSNGRERRYLGDLPSDVANLTWDSIIKNPNVQKSKEPTRLTSALNTQKLSDIYNKDIENILTGFYLMSGDDKNIGKKFNDSGITIYNLVNFANELEVILENKDDDTSKDVNGWSYIKWTTCVADLKKRKFKCEEMNYNGENGLINYIHFVEK